MTIIKDTDLFVVQSGTNNEVYNYSGLQLKDDINSVIAERDVKVWVQSDPPPLPLPPDYAARSDLWFDTSIGAFFIGALDDTGNNLIWIIVNPSDHGQFLDAADGEVKFPEGVSDGQTFENPNTGVTYYFRFAKSQWIDGDTGNFVSIGGDTMTGNLELPQLEVVGSDSVEAAVFIDENKLSVTAGIVQGELGPIQQPDTETDFPGGDASGVTFRYQEQYGKTLYQAGGRHIFVIGDYFYKVAFNTNPANGITWRTNKLLTDVQNDNDLELLDQTKFPAFAGDSGKHCVAVDPENDKVYIMAASGSSNTGPLYAWTLLSATYSTVNESGWKIEKTWDDVGSDASYARSVSWNPVFKKFIILYDHGSNNGTGIYIIDPETGIRTKKPKNWKLSGFNTKAFTFNKITYLLLEDDIVSSDDLFDTETLHNFKNTVASKFGVTRSAYGHGIYQSRHHFLYYGGEHISCDPDFSEDSFILHGKVPMGASTYLSNRLFLAVVGNYLLHVSSDSTQNIPPSFWDGEKWMACGGSYGLGQFHDVHLYTSEDGTVHVVLPTSGSRSAAASTSFPANALPPSLEDKYDPQQTGNNGDPNRLLFNGDRVALYKELKDGFDSVNINHDSIESLVDSITINHDSIESLKDYVDDSFVNKVGGDEMQGPLKVTGGRNANGDGIVSTVKTLNVDSGQSGSLDLKWNGDTKIYVGEQQTTFNNHIKFNQTGKQVYAGTDSAKKGLAFYSNGVQYVGDYTADNHVATKKKVEEAIYKNPDDTSTNKYVDRSGDTMSDELKIIKDGEAALTLSGKRDGLTNAVATIAFNNQKDTNLSYAGYLTYRNSGTTDDGLFRFNKNLELNDKDLKKVGNLQLKGSGAIKTDTHDQIKFKTPTGSGSGDGWVEIQRPSDNNRRGFTIRGKATDNTNTDILWTYTNGTGGDAVNYNGKMTGDDNLVNKKYVDDAVASAGGGGGGFVLKTGDTMTGNLNMSGTAAVKTRHLDSGQNSDLQIKRNGETKITVGTNNVIFNKMPTHSSNPSADNHLCRKKYVDDAVADAKSSGTTLSVLSEFQSLKTSNSSLSEGQYVPVNSSGNYTASPSTTTKIRLYKMHGDSLYSYRNTTQVGTITIANSSRVYLHGAFHYIEDAGNGDVYFKLQRIYAYSGNFPNTNVRINITGIR